MIKRRPRISRKAVTAGLVATTVVLVCYGLGALDWLEVKTLDLRFRYANSMPEDPRIVCVDIDDGSLERIGRWPWPRDVQAGVLSVLAELGAKAILFDVTLREPEPKRTVVPRQADLVGDPLHAADRDLLVALPDLELRATLAEAGDVYLAFDYVDDAARRPNMAERLRSAEFRQILATVERGDMAAADRLAKQFWPAIAASKTLNWALLAAQVVVALQADPALEDEVVAAQLGVRPRDWPASLVDACRGIAYRRRIERWLAAQPTRWQAPAPSLFRGAGDELFSAPGLALRWSEDIGLALREALSRQATLRLDFTPASGSVGAIHGVDDISPVYFLHARAARRCGFVVFEPDGDGVMRRMRLVVGFDGRVLPQLAFVVGCEALGLSAGDLRLTADALELRIAGQPQPRRIALDPDGRVWVPWVARRDWSQQFGVHLPADMLWQVHDRRVSVRHNEELALSSLAAVLERGLLASYAQYADDLKQRLRLQDELRLARYREGADGTTALSAWLADYERLLQADTPALAEAVRAACSAGDAGGESQRDLATLAQALAANDAYRAEIEATLAQIRPRVCGKLCLVGYTATALADMTPIPTNKRAPGIIAHANLLNGLLTGRSVSWAPRWLNALFGLLLGSLVAWLTARREPREAAGLAVAIALMYASLAGYVAFRAALCWVALTPVLAAIAASYVAVLLYRYIFLERESRQIATALSQYTSATLARKMAEDMELCKRAESREVTAIFTDLADFTSISERIGAERTQRVLNISLGCFADVMLLHEGMVNKFIGDGIFAFWNPVIYPQPDHARRACETAIDLVVAVRNLVETQRQAGGDEAFRDLVLRIGVATGAAVVGPCGSEKKYDYTCIGDSVNVAARLESANKFYGTRVLISGPTYEAAGDGFVVRSLGGVRVKGKTRAVPIFELLGRAGAVPDALLQYADLFGRAVQQFQKRAWGNALTLLDTCHEQRPDDRAAIEYAAAVRQYMRVPPDDDWIGALELTEK